MRPDLTKAMFAREIEEMMETTPLSRISVKELCRRCSSPRQTFYYHFRDKYELVAWIFFQDLLASGPLADEGSGSTGEHLRTILGKLQDRRTFYRRAFDGSWEVSILRYVYEFDVELALESLERESGEPVDATARFAVSFAAYGCMLMCIEWLNGSVDMDVSEMADCLEHCIKRLSAPDMTARA